MGKTARVALHRSPNGYAEVEHGATVGAQVGVNLYLNGVLVRPEDILNIYANPSTGETAPITYWRLIREIPQNVVALANAGDPGASSYFGTNAGSGQGWQDNHAFVMSRLSLRF